MPTLLDWGIVRDRVESYGRSLDVEDAVAFTYLSLDLIFGLDLSAVGAALTDGSGDRGVDAIYIQNDQGANIVNIVQLKHVNSFKNSVKNFPSTECDKLLSFIDDLLKQRKSAFHDCPPALQSKIKLVWDLLSDSVFDFKIHLISNASKLLPSQRDRFSGSLANFKCELHEYDLEFFSGIISGKKAYSRTLKIHVLDENYFERSDGCVRGLIGTIRGDDFVKFIKDPSNALIVDEALFDDNIRLFLGQKNEVNQKIFHSALSDNSYEFWYLNNGITVVCDKFRYNPSAASPLVEVENPQIVNGGQTSNSLFEAARTDPRKLKHVKVLAKIIETTDRGFRSRIAEATNSQTPIRSRDLRSNDVTQLKVEAIFASHGLYYERKKNQHSDQKRANRVDALTLGQTMLAYYLKEPDRAKTQSNKIFGEFYEMVFDESVITPQKLMTAHALYTELGKKRDIAILKSRTPFRTNYDEDWLVEGMFHVMFVLSLLCERNGILDNDFDQVSRLLDDAISQVGSYVQTQKRAAAYRIFRSAQTKENLKRLMFPSAIQMRLPLPEHN